MNRNFENRKPTKVYAKSKENQMIIKALNMYGRVPEMWELLEEIERLNNIINELEKEIDRLLERQYESERFAKEQGFDTYLPAKENLLYVKNKLQELKGSDKE